MSSRFRQELVALVWLDEHFEREVSCSSFARKKRQISTVKLVALVFLESWFDLQSGVFPISRNDLVAPLARRFATEPFRQFVRWIF